MFVENDRQVALILRAPMLSVLFLICWFGTASAQQPATVTFTLDFPNSEPDHYVISVSSDGHANYESNGKLSRDAEDDGYRLRSEEHTSELQSPFLISYAVFCLKK